MPPPFSLPLLQKFTQQNQEGWSFEENPLFYITGVPLKRIVLLLQNQCTRMKKISLMSDHLTLTTEAKKPPKWHFTPTSNTPLLPLPLFLPLCLPSLGARGREGLTLHSERAGSVPIPCDSNISIDQSKWRHVKLPRQLAGQ